MRLLFRVAYDGSHFAGWQRQAGGGTVQDAIEAAFFETLGAPVGIHGAGRTDAGVHACGQFFHVDLQGARLSLKEWPRALNARLPREVRILHVRQVPGDFHARFSAIAKHYRYKIRTAQILLPLELGRVWHYPEKLDEKVFRQAASAFVGTHDFAAFSANRGSPVADTMRTLFRLDVRRHGTLWTLDFLGDGFLYKMVRMIAAALVRAAAGRAPLDQLLEHLKNPKGPKWGHVAPACGLTLVNVFYRNGRAVKSFAPTAQD